MGTREDLLNLLQDYLVPERITRPIEKALEASGMTMQEISEIVLMGAGTRVPKVQEVLLQFLDGRDLGKSLNTDEAAAMGAVYKAADLSSGFKVKKFITRDAVVLPIDVNFERHFEDDSGNPAKKTVNKALFSKMNPFPQKKIMTFNKFQDDFDFHVNLNNLDHLEKHEVDYVGAQNLQTHTVKGLKAALENHTEESVESKGVKAHFNLDDSGLIALTSVEAVFEQTISVEQQIKEEEEKAKEAKETGDDAKAKDDKVDETWSKTLGDSINNFFGDKDKKDGDGSTDGETKDSKDEKSEDKKKKDKDKKKEKEEKKKS